jgi:LPXTG-motif cell wall-anchored protein
VPRTRRLLTLTCALLLGLPGTALAGGAGDDQYEDPFGDEPAGTTTQSAPAPAEPAPSETEAQGDQAAAEAAPSASAPAPATLPRTGADAGLAAIGGGALLLAGLALRRRTADELPD